jgi:hypothetical protein
LSEKSIPRLATHLDNEGKNNMNSAVFRVLQIDHVELFVTDRQAAAAWYESVLGLIPIPEAAQWAKDPEGPLMISSDQGKTMLALIQGTPQGERSS